MGTPTGLMAKSRLLTAEALVLRARSFRANVALDRLLHMARVGIMHVCLFAVPTELSSATRLRRDSLLLLSKIGPYTMDRAAGDSAVRWELIRRRTRIQYWEDDDEKEQCHLIHCIVRAVVHPDAGCVDLESTKKLDEPRQTLTAFFIWCSDDTSVARQCSKRSDREHDTVKSSGVKAPLLLQLALIIIQALTKENYWPLRPVVAALKTEKIDQDCLGLRLRNEARLTKPWVQLDIIERYTKFVFPLVPHVTRLHDA